MLKIAKHEIRMRKVSKRMCFIVLISIILSAIFINKIIVNGIVIDEGIYFTNIQIDYRPFKVSENPDIIIYGNVVYVKNNLKGYSAFDEFRNYVIKDYNRWIYEKFGEKAFPVLIKIQEIPTHKKTEISYREIVKPKSVTETPIQEKKEYIKPVKREEREKRVEKVNVTAKTLRSVEYITPDSLRPPILLKRFVHAFLFVMPFYFISQIFSSSFMEDKVNRRFEVLLTVLSSRDVIFGKMIPYIVIGFIISVIISIIFRNLIIISLLLPILLLMLSIDAFVVFLSRSYKENSFISIVVTLLITAYMFIPAIFSFIPMSKLSPIAVLIDIIEGGKLDIYLPLSIAHISAISLTLIYLTSNSFEFMYFQGLTEKLINLTSKLTDRYYKVFIFTIASLPFVLLFEMFTLAILYPVRMYIIPVLISLAVVEEFFKGLFVYSSKDKLNPYISAFISAFAFFSGEKLILLPTISNLSALFIIPLIAHIISTTIFVLTMRWGFKTGVFSSAIFHATYNGVIIWYLSS